MSDVDYKALGQDALKLLENAIKTAPSASIVTLALSEAETLKKIVAVLVSAAPAIQAPALDPNDRKEVDDEIEAMKAKQ